jgi:Fe2+ transport system protein FeoA
MLTPTAKSQSPDKPAKTLAGLRNGESAIVIAVTEPKAAARLGARGMVPGTELLVLRGGDPLLVGLDDTRWALSALDAAQIEVAPKSRALLPSLLRRLLS